MSCTKDKKDTAANETAAKCNKKLSKAKAKKGLQGTFPFSAPNPFNVPHTHYHLSACTPIVIVVAVLVQLPFVELKQFVTFAQVACRLCLLQHSTLRLRVRVRVRGWWGRTFDNEINEE